MRTCLYVCTIVVVLCVTGLPLLAAEVLLTHQGRLLDSNEAPVADGPKTLTFNLWGDSTGGSPLWTEVQDVVTSHGLFSAMLGRSNPLSLSLFSQGHLFFSVTIGGTELLPRTRLGSVPSAATAQRIQGDIFTAPGIINLESDPDSGKAEISGKGRNKKITLECKEGDIDIFCRRLSANGDTTSGLSFEVDQSGARSSLGGGNNLNWMFGSSQIQASSTIIDSTGDTLVQIGSGAFGSVYKGKWRSADVAVKHLFDAGADSTDAYFHLKKLSSVQSNPLYEQKGTSGGNVLYERSAMSGENPLYEAQSTARENVLYEHTGMQGENPLFEASMTAQGISLYDSLAEATTIFRANSIFSKMKSDVGPVRWMAPESMRLRNTSGANGSGGAIAADAMAAGAKVTVRGWDPEKKIVISNDDATNENYIEFLDSSGTSRVKISDFGMSRLAGHLAVGTDEDLATLTVGGDICATGTIGACSDERFKADIRPIEHALDIVTQMNGVTYSWNRDEFPEMNFSEREQVGLIAQEVQALVPEVVTASKTGYLAIDYSKLTPLLIEAVKELTSQNAAKETRIRTLEERLVKLEAAVSQTK